MRSRIGTSFIWSSTVRMLAKPLRAVMLLTSSGNTAMNRAQSHWCHSPPLSANSSQTPFPSAGRAAAVPVFGSKPTLFGIPIQFSRRRRDLEGADDHGQVPGRVPARAWMSRTGRCPGPLETARSSGNGPAGTLGPGIGV